MSEARDDYPMGGPADDHLPYTEVTEITQPREKKAMDSWYELRSEDHSVVERIENVTPESAKATARTVSKLTGQKLGLVKVTEIDVNAPPRTRGGS